MKLAKKYKKKKQLAADCRALRAIIFSYSLNSLNQQIFKYLLV